MKKVLLFFVCFCLFSSMTLVPSIELVQAVTFSDVGSEYWAQKAIADLTNKDIINGYPDGTFKPENNITRAEFAKVISLALGYPPDNTKPLGFSDLGLDHWSYGYVATAVEHGLVEGYPDGTYQPNKDVTKAEVLAIIARVEKWEAGSGDHFQDVASSHWAYGSIESCYVHEIVLNPDPYIVDEGNLYPDTSANRSQACVFVSRMLLAPVAVDPMDFRIGQTTRLENGLEITLTELTVMKFPPYWRSIWSFELVNTGNDPIDVFIDEFYVLNAQNERAWGVTGTHSISLGSDERGGWNPTFSLYKLDGGADGDRTDGHTWQNIDFKGFRFVYRPRGEGSSVLSIDIALALEKAGWFRYP